MRTASAATLTTTLALRLTPIIEHGILCSFGVTRLREKKICALTPHLGQVRLVKRMLKSRRFDKTFFEGVI